MKFRITFLWLFLGLTALAQKKDSLKVYVSGQLQWTNKRAATYAGLATARGDHWLVNIYYPDQSVMLSAYYADRSLRVKDGPFQFFHPGGIPGIRGQYVQDVKEGVWKYWYTNGQLKDSGLVKHNRSTGLWRSWDSTGRLADARWYTLPDQIADNEVVKRQAERNNKSLFATDTLVRVLDSAWQSWYPSGNKKDSGSYRNDSRTGVWKNWYPNGYLESEGFYSLNRQEGEWRYYRENSALSTIEKYRQGKLVSMQCFDEDGHPAGDFCSILKPPVPLLDRFTDFNTYALDHIFWPDSLQNQDVNGIVRVQFTITREGKLVDFVVLESPHQLLAEEVKRFLFSIPGWSPAISHNRTIRFTQVFEVPFIR